MVTDLTIFNFFPLASTNAKSTWHYSDIMIKRLLKNTL